MAIIEAECHIDFSSCLGVRPIKRQHGSVDINMAFSQGAGAQQPLTVIIKGAHAGEVLRLAVLANKSEEELAAYSRDGFTDEVEGKTDKECSDWVKAGIVKELMELAGDKDESVRGEDPEG